MLALRYVSAFSRRLINRQSQLHFNQKCSRTLTTIPQTQPIADTRPRIVEVEDKGEKVNAVFSEKEMMRRINNLRQYMSHSNVEACVMTSFHNICYFTGYMYCSFGRNFGLVVTQDRVVTISPSVNSDLAWRRSFGENVVYTDWQDGNYFHAVQQELKNIKGKIALEFDNVTCENMRTFDNVLPNKKVDLSQPVMSMRMIKSQEEIDVIKEGARVADIGGAAMVNRIEEGIPEYEVALSGLNAMTREIARTYPKAELRDTWTWFQSGRQHTRGCHTQVTSRQVQKGDILSVNCFPMIEGYYTAMERNAFFDHVSDEALKIWEVNCKVHKRGTEIIQPGVRCCDVTNELNDIYSQHGLLKYRTFGYGHSFGVMSHYFGRESGMEFREDVETVLQPGMVVSMEPMITIPPSKPGAGGYREHDIIVLTEDGAENITKFPVGPEHMIFKSKP